ncbi:hypothetical protein CBD41_00835 [bacterium TMED181]|nr:hypothetical protein [Planctomycetota bacterium]OUW47528.1 MAG: hypothetical protein CBD41_00835 [bacterium TMED181]
MSLFVRLSAVFLAVIIAAPAVAQTAKIKHPGADGVWGTADDTERLVQRDPNLRFFNTEGPTWDMDPVAFTCSAVGKVVTIPLEIDGAPYHFEATEQVELGLNGELLHGPIVTSQFDRMDDINAMPGSAYLNLDGQQLALISGVTAGIGGPLRSGATRSLFSTQEALLPTGFDGVDSRSARDVANTLDKIALNHFTLVEKALALPGVADVLPADFRARNGLILNDDGTTTYVYPMQSGGTYKSAGHVYTDPIDGGEYLIPDTVNVFELSENTAAGEVTFVSFGTPSSLDNDGNIVTGTPDCFVVDGLLCMFNQDPRFPAEVFGAFEQAIPREMFLTNMNGRGIDMVGYMVGDHIMYAMEVFTDLVNLDGEVEVSVERWRYNNNGNEIRFRGGVDEPDGVTLVAMIHLDSGATLEFNIPLAAATDENGGPAPGAQFGARLEFDLIPTANVINVTAITLEARHPTEGVVFSEMFDRCENDPDSCLPDGE